MVEVLFSGHTIGEWKVVRPPMLGTCLWLVELFFWWTLDPSCIDMVASLFRVCTWFQFPMCSSRGLASFADMMEENMLAVCSFRYDSQVAVRQALDYRLEDQILNSQQWVSY